MLAELIPRIAAEEARDERRSGTWRPRCSSAGTEGCIRQEAYKAHEIPQAPLPGRAALIFDDGHWHEELTLNWLRKSVYEIHSEQLALNVFQVKGSHDGYICSMCSPKNPDGSYIKGKEVHVPKDWVHGHIDAIATDPMRVDYLLEHKSSNHFAFQRWANGTEVPLNFVIQSCCYIKGMQDISSNVERASILIKNKNTAQYLEFVLRFDVANDTAFIEEAIWMEGETRHEVYLDDEQRVIHMVLAQAHDRFAEIVRLRDAKVVPARGFTFDHWRCQYCAFAGTCWEGYDAEIASAAEGGPVELPQDDPIGMRALEYYNENERLKEQDKKVSALKADLRVALMSINLRDGFMRVGEDTNLTINVDVRSRTGLDKDKIPGAILKAAEVVNTHEQLSIRKKSATPKKKATKRKKS
ncbi:MAG TPA: hypothetical protein VFH61_06380 [Thermoleophilia bacterium]|nr:hypothetical protein [Thermoleophilia bacterium]